MWRYDGHILLLVMALTCCGGCASDAQRLAAIRADYYRGDLTQAAAKLDAELQASERDNDVRKLDQAILQLAAGEPEQAEQTLREVRDRFDALEQARLGESAWTMATDDSHAAYAGEDYEKVLIRSFLALSNLLGDGDDAAAYSWQILEKQRQIIEHARDQASENPQPSYKQIALGAYLHGLMREATHVHYDDAERSFTQVVSWEPGFRHGATDLQRARAGHHSASGHGVLFVFALVGRGPVKQEVLEQPTSTALLIADQILSATGKHTLPPTVAPVKVPQVVLAPQNVSRVAVSVDGQPYGTTETITDIGRMALEQHRAVYPRIVARAVVRRVVKKGVIYTTKDVIGEDNTPLLNLALDVTGVVWEASESADLRCWALLPDRIQVMRLELPAGDHEIALEPLLDGRPCGASHRTVVAIEDGRNSYALASYPGQSLVGAIVSSRPPGARVASSR